MAYQELITFKKAQKSKSSFSIAKLLLIMNLGLKKFLRDHPYTAVSTFLHCFKRNSEYLNLASEATLFHPLYRPDLTPEDFFFFFFSIYNCCVLSEVCRIPLHLCHFICEP